MAVVTSKVVKKTAPATPALPWWQQTFALAALSALLLWAALPPLDLGGLAWVAPVPWLLLVRREQLPGWRPYRALWLVGFGFWLAAVHWLRLPHWATHFGWLALAFYLAFYLPVFIGLSRVAVHQLKVPLIVAAPVVWTGLELARAHLLSGFLMASLAHTQYRWIELIQISDLFGAYGVSFVIMLVAACLAHLWPQTGRRRTVWPLLPAGGVLLATLLYGHARLAEEPPAAEPDARVALIQGSIDADWKADPQKNQRIFAEYFGLSQQAVRESKVPLDLIVWPETMYRNALYHVARDAQPPAEMVELYREANHTTESHLASMTARLGTPLLLGIDIIELIDDASLGYNSAVAVTRTGKVAGHYSKIHRVMFGEYIPLADLFPWLYEFTPLTGGLEAGSEVAAFEIEGVRYAPNICYESTVPHVIRQQVRQLDQRGESPQVLVNLTNDAWFWGSSELDMHLACAVFRAIECRRPFLIAANGGISAQLDGSGRIVEQSPKRQTDVIVADVRFDPRQSWYLTAGDWPAGICLAGCVALAGIGLVRQRQVRNKSKSHAERAGRTQA